MTAVAAIRLCAFAGLLSCPITALAQDEGPADAERAERRELPPQENQRDRRIEGEREDRFDRLDRGRFGRSPSQLPTEEEWQETTKFMEAHAPHFRKKIIEVRDLSTMAVEHMRSTAFARFREFRSLERDNPELYQVRVKLLSARDAMFGLHAELRNAPEDQRDEIQQRMRDQINQQIELSFQERELRISDLEKRVSEERDRLKQDRERQPEMVDRRLHMELEKGHRSEPGLAPGDAGPGGPGGPGGPRGHDRPRHEPPSDGQDRPRGTEPGKGPAEPQDTPRREP